MRSGIVVALPLTAVSSQFVIGSFEARFFAQDLFVGQTFVSVTLGNTRKWQTGMSAPQRVRLDFDEQPRLRPAFGQKHRFFAECAGRALSPFRS